MCAIAGVPNYNDRAKASTYPNRRKTERFSISSFGLCRPQLTSAPGADRLRDRPPVDYRTVFIASRRLSPSVDNETCEACPRATEGGWLNKKKTRGETSSLDRVEFSMRVRPDIAFRALYLPVGNPRCRSPGALASYRVSVENQVLAPHSLEPHYNRVSSMLL